VTARPALSEPLDPLAHDDPVAAVLHAHAAGVPLLLSTSGSSGATRQVRRTTASWFGSFPAVARLTGLDETARVFVPGPIIGTMNLFAAVLTRALGARRVDAVEDATHAHVTPTELRRLLTEGRPVAGVRVTVAGDRLGADLHDRAVGAGAVVSHYYGAAELSFVAWGRHEHDLRPFPGVEVVDRGGVLWVCSPYLALVPGDAEGFATVGDRGTVTADGRVLVHGRGDAAVVTGGVTVVVEDVEAALGPDLGGELVVVGVPHPDLGEVVAAVLTRAGDLETARHRARAGLRETHRPRLWFVTDALPRTSAGKVDRSAARALAAAGRWRRLVPAAAR
jgi:long-chain acyl-CoA synthetase